MRRTAVALLAFSALAALAGCGAGAPAPHPRFPDPTPSGTELAYAATYRYTILNGSRQSIGGEHESLALTRDRSVSFSCRKGARRHRVKSISRQLAKRWRELLTRAKLASIRSDNRAARPIEYPELWFEIDDHVVYIQPGRHEHQAPCHGTGCAAVLRFDATLRALNPSWDAFQNFLEPRCRAELNP